MKKLSIILVALVLMGAMTHEHAEHTPTSQQAIKLSVLEVQDKLVRIKLTDKDQAPVTLNDLKEVHTQKIHLLIIDDGLQDYTHTHPKPTQTPGEYEFEWSPVRANAHYRIWADLTPINQSQEFVMAELTKGPKQAIIRKDSFESVVNGLTFKLTLDKNMGKITVIDADGKPFKKLEPVMGAFAHIVAFSDNFKTVIHAHPMGDEPKNPTDRGGPELQFHMEPLKPGFVKIFAQVVVNGQELFVPFGIQT